MIGIPCHTVRTGWFGCLQPRNGSVRSLMGNAFHCDTIHQRFIPMAVSQQEHEWPFGHVRHRILAISHFLHQILPQLLLGEVLSPRESPQIRQRRLYDLLTPSCRALATGSSLRPSSAGHLLAFWGCQ